MIKPYGVYDITLWYLEQVYIDSTIYPYYVHDSTLWYLEQVYRDST